MYTDSHTKPKNLKFHMIILTCLVYVINTAVMLFMRIHVDYFTMFNGADFTTVFQIGMVFGLICVAGYLYVPGPHLKRMFTFGYMLPLTGTSMISINALYSIQKGVTGEAWTWLMMGALVLLLAVSFGASYRIMTYTLESERG